MKRLLFLMLLCSPLLFTSCEENYYGAYVDTYYTTVGARDWYEVGTLGQPGYIWEAYKNVDFLTSDVIEYGAVLVYAVHPDYGDIQLPDVYSDRVGGSDFVQVLGYRLVNGRIYFTIEASDYETEPFDYAMEYKIVVIH